jgi:uncharacterized peroxidase-related enzyme
VRHHGAGLLKLTKNEGLVRSLIEKPGTARLDAADRAMLDYALKLTSEPWNMEEQDVRNLRDQGFSDTAILDICQVTAYYAYVNRLADGLGVELEDLWQGLGS